tara:strand:- start:44 stop:337 length:294 start_codon:yes stop_codon:yes gene_type:complete
MMKTYRQLKEDLWDDIQKNIEKKGEVYELVANTVMLSKWTGIRKTVAPHIRALKMRNKVYIMRWDIKKKQIPNRSIMESVDLKVWKKLISNKEIKKI